jgi:hypothetical protein
MIQITCGMNRFPNCDEDSPNKDGSVKAVPSAGNTTKLTPVKKASIKTTTMVTVLELMMSAPHF